MLIFVRWILRGGKVFSLLADEYRPLRASVHHLLCLSFLFLFYCGKKLDSFFFFDTILRV